MNNPLCSVQHARESIEDFATISAALADRFASRAAVLSAAGLDEPTWKHLCEGWLARLSAGTEPDLARRFSACYRRAQNALHTSMPGTERTIELPACPPEPPLPFMPPRGPSPYAEQTYGSIEEALLANAATPGDPTLPRLILPAQPPVLPFRPVPASPAPRRRLHRFDSQTGLPLAEPIWVDTPSRR